MVCITDRKTSAFYVRLANNCHDPQNFFSVCVVFEGYLLLWKVEVH
jgi:hypothetical protein